MKNRIVLFIAGCCALLLSSCLGSDDTQYELSKDCQILSFSLSNDSIPGLKDVVFTIDQVEGKIFNIDSMPYGTKLDEKVICTVKLASTVYTCQVMQEAISDTLSYWNLVNIDLRDVCLCRLAVPQCVHELNRFGEIQRVFQVPVA